MDLRSSLGAVIVTTLALVGVPAEAAVIFDGGAPDQYATFYGDTTYDFSEVAESFVLSGGSNTITDVHWWGACSTPSNEGVECPAGDFTLAVYDDASGSPGTVVATFSVDGAQTSTGNLIGGIYPEYSYSADIAALTLDAGATYWLGISDATSADVIWGWETTDPVDGGDHYQRLSGNWIDIPFNNLAFNLTGTTVTNGVPEPATLGFFGAALAGLGAFRRRRR
jgi:hypothetical protein